MKNLYLIGFMGVGKTTFAFKLSQNYHCLTIDLDEYIVKKNGQSISEYIAKNGMMSFRKQEFIALNEVSQKNCYIIACGGGIISTVESRQFLKNEHVLYLEADFELLYERIRYTSETRPLVKEKTKQELYQLYKERKSYYDDVATKKVKLSNNMIENDLKIKKLIEQWKEERK